MYSRCKVDISWHWAAFLLPGMTGLVMPSVLPRLMSPLGRTLVLTNRHDNDLRRPPLTSDPYVYHNIYCSPLIVRLTTKREIVKLPKTAAPHPRQDLSLRCNPCRILVVEVSLDLPDAKQESNASHPVSDRDQDRQYFPRLLYVCIATNLVMPQGKSDHLRSAGVDQDDCTGIDSQTECFRLRGQDHC